MFGVNKNKMKDQFVPYEQAFQMKELGFDEKCIAYWQGENSKEPTISIDQGTIYVSDFHFHRNTFLSPSNDIMVIPNEEAYSRDLIENPHKYQRLRWSIKVIAPLWQQAFDWFSDHKKMSSHIIEHNDGRIYWRIIIKGNKTGTAKGYSKFEKSRQEARIECLKKLIELSKLIKK